jgi:mono/diheme cytochrome c family protein
MLVVDSRITVLLLFALPTLAALPAPSGAREDVPEEVAARANPETLEEDEVRYYARQYKAKCARCHGRDGSGAGEEAAEQEVPPADFTDLAFMKSRTDGQFYYQILMGGGERCAMPAFGPESSDAWKDTKIWHMVAYVRRFAAASEQ